MVRKRKVRPNYGRRAAVGLLSKLIGNSAVCTADVPNQDNHLDSPKVYFPFDAFLKYIIAH
jgi:hypothetical protein